MPPSLQDHRLHLYGAFSTVLVSAVIASAFHKHSNFYSATVYLSRSSASVMVYRPLLCLSTVCEGHLTRPVALGSCKLRWLSDFAVRPHGSANLLWATY